MNERLLQYIWQFQYYNKNELRVEQGDNLTIINQGRYNSNQGPDFLDAKVTIGNTTWAGNIEIHIKSSDWLRHSHEGDKNYANVILHVVWENDKDITDAGGTVLPALCMQNRVAKILLDRFKELMVREAFVPCGTIYRLWTI